MFGPWSQCGGLCSIVVLKDLIQSGESKGLGNVHLIGDFLQQIAKTKHFSCCGRQCNVLSFHHAEGHFSLQLGSPTNGHSVSEHNVPCARMCSCWIFCISCLVECSSKVCIYKSIHAGLVCGGEDDPLVCCTFQVAHNLFYCLLMWLAWVMSKTGTLMQGKGNIWTGIAAQVHEHPEHRGIIPGLLVLGLVFV
jgi:hypothetical protein